MWSSHSSEGLEGALEKAEGLENHSYLNGRDTGSLHCMREGIEGRDWNLRSHRAREWVSWVWSSGLSVPFTHVEGRGRAL